MPPQPPTPDSPSNADLMVIAEPEAAPPEASPEQAKQLSFELALAEQQLLEIEEARDQRRKYARRIFRLVCCWLVLVGYTVIAQAFGVGFGQYGRFHLDNSVLIALITTTTATVIGVFAIVLNYLFPKRTAR
jgi:hypothetical protein